MSWTIWGLQNRVAEDSKGILDESNVIICTRFHATKVTKHQAPWVRRFWQYPWSTVLRRYILFCCTGRVRLSDSPHAADHLGTFVHLSPVAFAAKGVPDASKVPYCRFHATEVTKLHARWVRLFKVYSWSPGLRRLYPQAVGSSLPNGSNQLPTQLMHPSNSTLAEGRARDRVVTPICCGSLSLPATPSNIHSGLKDHVPHRIFAQGLCQCRGLIVAQMVQ